MFASPSTTRGSVYPPLAGVALSQAQSNSRCSACVRNAAASIDLMKAEMTVVWGLEKFANNQIL
jgi:hypothetical protein